MLYSDFQELLVPVNDPQADATVSASTAITAPATADYVVVWSSTQGVDVKHVPKASTAVAVAGEGIAIAAGFANAQIFSVHNAKLVAIETTASAVLRWQAFRKLSIQRG